MLWLLACTGKTPAPPLADEGVPPEEPTVEAAVEEPGDLSQREEIRFLVLGDSGYAGEDATAVGALAAQVCEQIDCDFTLYVGDNVYPDGVQSVDDPLFQSAYEQAFGGIGVPAWMVLGNHDHRGNIQAQIDYQSPTWRMPARHYRVPGLPEWLVLYGWDSQELLKRPDSELSKEMLAALKSELCSTQGWAMPFAHHPNLSSGPHGHGDELEGIRALTEPIWAECGVQASFAGHDHHLENLDKNGYLTLISGAASKTRPVCDAEGLAKKAPCAKRGVLGQRFLSGEYGFMAMTVSETSARMDVYVLGNTEPVWGYDIAPTRSTE